MTVSIAQEKPGVATFCWVGVATSALLLADAILFIGSASAQVSGDGSFNTLVNGSATGSCVVALCTIEGGLQNSAGSTLFHSFREFSPGAAGPQSALFVDPGVNDIIVRVTGGGESFVNGLIETSAGSSANLFVVNSEGIRLGADASLNIGGSFTASSANQVLFDGEVAIATESPTAPPAGLLTVSAPIGLGFLSDTQSGQITVEGNGNLLFFNGPQFVERALQTASPPPVPFPLPPFTEVAVQPGNDIALIGNGVSISGGNLAALGGQIAIGSIESGNIFFRPESRSIDNPTANLDYAQVDAFSDITLDSRASLDVSAGRSGAISLRGRNITVADGSGVLAETLAVPEGQATSGGFIDVAATDLVLITNSPDEPDPAGLPLIFSYLAVDVAPGATGPGGRVNIAAQDLTIENGAQIGANTFGLGNAGSIGISIGDELTVRDIGSIGVSGIFSTATEMASGDAGFIDIDTGALTVEGGGAITTRSDGSVGASGTIDIDARRTVSLLGVSRPVEVPDPMTGSVMTLILPSTIENDTGSFSVRQGGDVTVNAAQLFVRDGAAIVSATGSAAAGGSLTISAGRAEIAGSAGRAEIAGFDAVGPSLLTTTANATGDGGDLTLNVDRLFVTNLAQVSTGTTGSGNAGDLLVNSDSVLVSGFIPNVARSGFFASAINDTGDGGNLTVNTDTLRVLDGGTLSVSNFSSVPGPLPPGQGSAGNLEINASQVRLEGGAVLNASTAAGDRGNITLNTAELLFLSGESLIAANAGGSATGGNITVNSPDGFLVTTPEANSDITANAVLGDGGQVNITARSVLGIEPRPALTDASDITAASEFGVAGETRVEAVDSELPEEPSPLPASAEIAEVAQGCDATGSSGQFVQTGRGGVGTSPYGILDSRNSFSDVSVPSSLSSVLGGTAAQSSEATAAQTAITEAQGWAVDGRGNVVLMAANSGVYESDRCLIWRS